MCGASALFFKNRKKLEKGADVLALALISSYS